MSTDPSTNLQAVRLKYLLGELHLASWRPLMQVVRRTPDLAREWPSPEDVPPERLDPRASGYWCREAETNRFRLGVQRWDRWLCYVPRREHRHVVSIGADFEGYLSQWSSKTRYNIRRSVKKLVTSNAEPVLEVAEAPDAMEAFLREAAAISVTTYQHRLLKSGLEFDDATLAAMKALAATGRARGYLLRDRGKAIAFAWCSASGDRLHYSVVGYLEEQAAQSPGTVLLYLILEDLFSLGRFKILDFGVGDAPYKRLFANETMEFADVHLFRPTVGNRLRALLHWYSDRFSAGCGAVLERWGLKSRIRRLMRTMLARPT